MTRPEHDVAVYAFETSFSLHEIACLMVGVSPERQITPEVAPRYDVIYRSAVVAARHGVNECYVLHKTGKGLSDLKRNALYPWWALMRLHEELIPLWDGVWHDIFEEGGAIEGWRFERETVAWWLRGRAFVSVFDFNQPGGAVLDLPAPDSSWSEFALAAAGELHDAHVQERRSWVTGQVWGAVRRVLDDEGQQQPAEPPALAAARAHDRGPWPWGAHETKLLRDLAAAAGQWWGTFDPADPSTAPKNDDVAAWLVNRGVSPGVASAMATMLRADGLQTGRRRKG